MPSAGPEASELFDVVILRFESRTESAAERLQRVFGLQPLAAEALLAELPATVRRGVNRMRAEYFRRALIAIGAQVEVRDATGNAVAPEPVSTQVPARVSQARAVDGVELRGGRDQPDDCPLRASAQSDGPSQRSAGGSAILQGPASARPFALQLDSETAGARSFSWHVCGASNDHEPIALPAAAPPPNCARERGQAAFADTPASPRAAVDIVAPGDLARASELAWGELDRGPARAPRPRARRQQQPTSPRPAPGTIERIGPSSPRLDLDQPPSMPAPARWGESARPSARRGSNPSSAAPREGRGADSRAMLGRCQLGGDGERPGPEVPAANQPRAMENVPMRRASTVPDTTARLVSPARTAARAPGVARRAAPVELRSFWECLPEVLSFPFLGRGLFWVISIAVWGIGANLLSALAGIMPLVGASVAFFANTSVLAMCADYHRRCMWAVANAESELDEGPDFDPARILHGYMRAGAQLVIFMAVSQLPLALWIASAIFAGGLSEGLEAFNSPLFWLLAIGPACYWPAAVACASLYNRFSSVWFVPVGMRLILRAPLEYLAILFVGGSAFLLPWLLALIVGKAADLPSAFFAATTGLPLALSHALMGSLTGQLMRTRPDAFE